MNKRKKIILISFTILILIILTIFLLKPSKIEIKEVNKDAIIYDNYRNNYMDTKYILLWTNPKKIPFVYLGEGTKTFEQKNCRWKNCYVTSDRKFLGDYSEFHVIAFHGPELPLLLYKEDLPWRRSREQKYVFANIESAARYGICDTTWNGYFNWTWTYRLDSDALWGYFVVKNSSGHVVGPNTNMTWIDNAVMESPSDELISILKVKPKAAAWFVSNCNTLSKREKMVEKMQLHLKKFNLAIDVYGECGVFQCPKSIMKRCLKMLEREYHFYLAFENAISEDYVTEKIVYALNFNVIPIVYGGANYTRFLPDGSYINARVLGAQKVAELINYLIRNKTAYYEYFKWKRYYSYHFRKDDIDTDDYCNFCSQINNDKVTETITVYNNFTQWWTPKGVCN